MDFNPSGHESAPNHERWMISYADFVTLLFAVFVVLFASASTNKNTGKQVSEAVIAALKNGTISFVSRSRAPGPVKGSKETAPTSSASAAAEQQAVVELVPSIAALSHQFEKEIAAGKIDIRVEPRGLVISLRQAAFFESGQARINAQAYPIVDKIAALIHSVPNRVSLEGHTDAIPIRNSRFASNWELSAARSIAMLDQLGKRNKVPRERIAIAGFADTVPVERNDDPQGRAHNRRVDVVIMNELLVKTPVKTGH